VESGRGRLANNALSKPQSCFVALHQGCYVERHVYSFSSSITLVTRRDYISQLAVATQPADSSSIQALPAAPPLLAQSRNA